MGSGFSAIRMLDRTPRTIASPPVPKHLRPCGLQPDKEDALPSFWARCAMAERGLPSLIVIKMGAPTIDHCAHAHKSLSSHREPRAEDPGLLGRDLAVVLLL